MKPGAFVMAQSQAPAPLWQRPAKRNAAHPLSVTK
jgi:hypothetical protein